MLGERRRGVFFHRLLVKYQQAMEKVQFPYYLQHFKQALLVGLLARYSNKKEI